MLDCNQSCCGFLLKITHKILVLQHMLHAILQQVGFNYLHPATANYKSAGINIKEDLKNF